MQTPGVPPIPHVGGPIVGPGVPNVLIGGLPAAVVGDTATCVGPPDSIVKGSAGVMIGGRPAARMGDTTVHGGSIVLGFPTVMIGEIPPPIQPPVIVVPPFAEPAAAKPSSAKDAGQAGNSQAAKAAKPKAAEKEKPLYWVEFQLIGEDKKGVPLERYIVTLPDGTVKEGVTGLDGRIRYEGIETAGSCKITFPDLDQDAWEEG